MRHSESVHLTRFPSEVCFNGDVIMAPCEQCSFCQSDRSMNDIVKVDMICLIPPSPLSLHDETLPVCDPVWDIDNLTFSLSHTVQLLSLVHLLVKLLPNAIQMKNVPHVKIVLFTQFSYQYS